ncbi:MAG: type III toxin-antitoxin system ToxN/AbiQ family toxin [Clostridia bacterium]|nr:type III toxin-antitoxin system ToxN/AbiQ family toxin [Clostridia bacterium]
MKLKIVRVDSEYCDYLRKFDNKVSYNKDGKELRPFIGILFNIENIEYFAQLSSPKQKHVKMKNMVDFLKIKNGELEAVNFNISGTEISKIINRTIKLFKCKL